MAAAVNDVTSARSAVVSEPVMSRVGYADAGEPVRLPVPTLLDATLPRNRGRSRDALGPVRCRLQFRDLSLGQPGDAGEHLDHRALVITRRDPRRYPVE
jgi:hypothetical protein